MSSRWTKRSSSARCAASQWKFFSLQVKQHSCTVRQCKSKKVLLNTEKRTLPEFIKDVGAAYFIDLHKSALVACHRCTNILTLQCVFIHIYCKIREDLFLSWYFYYANIFLNPLHSAAHSKTIQAKGHCPLKTLFWLSEGGESLFQPTVSVYWQEVMGQRFRPNAHSVHCLNLIDSLFFYSPTFQYRSELSPHSKLEKSSDWKEWKLKKLQTASCFVVLLFCFVGSQSVVDSWPALLQKQLLIFFCSTSCLPASATSSELDAVSSAASSRTRL